MWNFCNDDKNLIRKGGRKAPLISKLEFQIKIKEYCIKHKHEIAEEYFNKKSLIELNSMKLEEFEKFFVSHFYENSNDINIHLSNENICSDHCMFGIKILKNSLPIYGVYCGGDWEIPVFYCIYWNGTKFRGYIPRYGNTYNVITKGAFGNRYFDYELGLKKYKKDIIRYLRTRHLETDEDEEIIGDYIEEPFTYMNIYGHVDEDHYNNTYEIINEKAIEEDIINRIEII